MIGMFSIIYTELNHLTFLKVWCLRILVSNIEKMNRIGRNDTFDSVYCTTNCKANWANY